MIENRQKCRSSNFAILAAPNMAHPMDRRFHSQTNSCPRCGPRLWLAAAADVEISEHEAAVDDAIAALCSQKILAVKGIGGYQLVVDATSPAAVQELRRRKRRCGKPLAVMVQDLCAAELLAGLGDIERQALTDSSNPIVVAPRRPSVPLAREVTAGLNTVGLMLPSTPLHEFLARRTGRPLVVTSGNLEGDPLAFDTTMVTGELFGAADLFLHHDRPISQPIDDSVVQVIAGQLSTVRLARRSGPALVEIGLRARDFSAGRTSKGGHCTEQRCASGSRTTRRRFRTRSNAVEVFSTCQVAVQSLRHEAGVHRA